MDEIAAFCSVLLILFPSVIVIFASFGRTGEEATSTLYKVFPKVSVTMESRINQHYL